MEKKHYGHRLEKDLSDVHGCEYRKDGVAPQTLSRQRIYANAKAGKRKLAKIRTTVLSDQVEGRN